jgi:ketosteroid isomerase-like protein
MGQEDGKHHKHPMPMPGMQMGHDTHTPASEIRKALVNAWNSGEVNKLIALYGESAVIILPDGKLVTGRQSIHEYLQKLISRRSQVALSSVGSDTSPDLQVDFGIFTEFQPRASSIPSKGNSKAQQELEGKYLMVVKRMGQDWKIQEQMLVLGEIQ